MKPRQPITAAAATAAVLADDLVPETLYYTIHGGRSKFQEFEREGLPIYKQNSRRCVRPSEVKKFMTSRAVLVNPEAVLMAART